MTEPRKSTIETVKELSERCADSSWLSEEIENSGISPADLVGMLLIAVEALEEIDRREKVIDSSYSRAEEALSRIRSL